MKIDRRVKRTRKLLSQALVNLTLTNGYDAVSIRDITAEAHVGYATFFRHYKSKDELLIYVLDSFVAELLQLLQSGALSPEEEGERLFEHAATNSELYRVLLGSSTSSRVIDRIHEISLDNIKINQRHNPDSIIPVEIASHHIASSVLALLQWWLKNEQPYSPTRMGKIYANLIIQPTMRQAFLLE